jgi:hypothetical protein
LPVEHEARDRADEVGVAHQRQRAVVQDQPLAVDADRDRGVIFIREDVLEDDDLDIVLRKTRGAQRQIFDNRIVLTVAPIGLQRLERRAPTIGNAPLRVVAGRADGEIDRTVDQSYPGTAGFADAARAQRDQFLRGRRANDIRATLCDRIELAIELSPGT